MTSMDSDVERGKDIEKSYLDEKRPAQRASNHTLLLYQTLDSVKSEFRLLILLPPKGSWESEPVGCKIEHAYLDDPPPYYALSYHWGNPSATLPIRVNGQDVQVTTNLEAALRELRARGILTVWVDALCINQQDPVEKGLQVMRMGSIYSRAVEVLAWLGPETEGSVIAMNRLGGLNFPTSEAVDSKHTRDLFGRPYWKRVCKFSHNALSDRGNLVHESQLLTGGFRDHSGDRKSSKGANSLWEGNGMVGSVQFHFQQTWSASPP